MKQVTFNSFPFNYYCRLCHIKIRSSGFSVIIVQWDREALSSEGPSNISLILTSRKKEPMSFDWLLSLDCLLFNLNPEYFFSCICTAQFSGDWPWSLNKSSLEKSKIFLLLEHQIFFEAKSLFLSVNVIFTYSLEDFSRYTPWNRKC